MDDEQSRGQGRKTGQPLSPRETQMLLLAAQGLTDAAISNKLQISLTTVGTYWLRMRHKFGLISRTEMVATYLQEVGSKATEALREANRHLLDEVAHHAQALSELSERFNLISNIIESAPDAILLVNQSGAIILANERATEIFGYSKDELPNRHVDHLVPEMLRDSHAEHRDGYLKDPAKRRMGSGTATRAVRKDGTEILIAAALSASETPAGLMVTCIIRVITEPVG